MDIRCRAILICLLVANIVWFASTFTSDELRITLANGSKLVGRYYRSYSGRPIKAFMGIPYAKPPIGRLRFRDPEPAEKWYGEFMAVNDVPECPQQNPFLKDFKNFGDEDCLHLNVYVPHKYDEPISNLPVMVRFHGGGFAFFSTQKIWNGPDMYLDQDVILVAANYRLGALGFLSTEDENCSGNFGLKDNVMAVKWVRENIIQFVGDPESVTIMGGCSAGATITYLLSSPLAEGLFSRAIAQSGTNLGSWFQPARKRAIQVAECVNCYNPNHWSETIECMRGVPAYNISAVAFEHFVFHTDPKVIFPPVIEPDLPGAFLSEDLRDVIANRVSKVPFLTGVNYNEGLFKSLAVLTNPELYDDFANNLDRFLPLIFYYNHHELPLQEAITKKIKEFYFDNHLTKDKVENVTNLFGDAWYLSPTDEYLRLRLANEQGAPTFMYLFTPRMSASHSELRDPDHFYGVSHMDELIYLDPLREQLFITTLPTKEDEQMREALVRLWTDFARTGNPTPESSSLPKWEPVEGFPMNYYRIGNLNFEDKPVFGMETGGFFEDRTKFWRDLAAFAAANQQSRDEL